MDIRPLRVRLDLAKVNVPSYRRYVWYPVSPCALSTIGDLKANICRKFSLSLGEVLLFVDGGLMQDEDTVLLLRENDVVQVVYTSEYQANLQPVYEDFMDLMPPGTLSDAAFLRRSRNLSDVSSLERKRKKKKKKTDELNGFDVVAQPDDEGNTPVDQNGASTSQSLIQFGPMNSQGEVVLPSSAEIDSCDNAEALLSDVKTEHRDLNSAKCTFKEPKRLLSSSDCLIESKDLGFEVKERDGPTATCSTAEGPTNADVGLLETEKILSEVKSTSCKKRKRRRKRKRAKEQVSFNLFGDQGATVFENGKHIKFTDVATMDEVSADRGQAKAGGSISAGTGASEETDSESNDSAPPTTAQVSNIEEPVAPPAAPVVKIDYTVLPKLPVPPPVGTRIAFKILELSELYCPEVSSFKEGVITALHTESENIVIQLAKREMRQPRIGKFENIYQGRPPECELIQKIILKWTDLIDPRLMPQG